MKKPLKKILFTIIIIYFIYYNKDLIFGIKLCNNQRLRVYQEHFEEIPIGNGFEVLTYDRCYTWTLGLEKTPIYSDYVFSSSKNEDSTKQNYFNVINGYIILNCKDCSQTNFRHEKWWVVNINDSIVKKSSFDDIPSNEKFIKRFQDENTFREYLEDSLNLNYFNIELKTPHEWAEILEDTKCLPWLTNEQMKVD